MSVNDEVVDNKNKNNLRCQFCYSLILKKAQGDYVQQEIQLPLMYQKHTKEANTIGEEPVSDFWLVPDMFTFENIGFSNTVEHRKYLTCADCDMGPVGYHDINTKQSFVALKRVAYGDNPDCVIHSSSPVQT